MEQKRYRSCHLIPCLLGHIYIYFRPLPEIHHGPSPPPPATRPHGRHHVPHSHHVLHVHHEPHVASHPPVQMFEAENAIVAPRKSSYRKVLTNLSVLSPNLKNLRRGLN